ncbi:MAG TPA: alkaline phosphatase family protein [Vicinamibacterales bacterium]|nr:alkaline phosphatase family protein [Vicinamibacterales bacterium]
MRTRLHRSSRTVAGACVIAAGVTGAAWLSASSPNSQSHPVPMTARGVVAGTFFTPPDGGTASSTVPSYFQGARVCADLNDNGACDPGEASTATDRNGRFVLHSQQPGPIVAEVLASSTSSAGDTEDGNKGRKAEKGKKGGPGGSEPADIVVAFRASLDQIVESASGPGKKGPGDGPLSADVVLSPLTTEVARMMEADGLPYPKAKSDLATRLGVPVEKVLTDLNTVSGHADQHALLTESNILSDRFTLAATMVRRHDVSPAALAANPAATAPAIAMKEAQQASMNLEGIPRYDHVFVIMLENKATATIKNSPFAPKINAYLNAGNQFTSYFANGNPSEPNRMAVTAADDFGVTDDNSYTCVPAGDSADAVEDLPLPTGVSPCTQATNHNIKNRSNLLTALAGGGMTWRVYSESMNPGRDPRADGIADPTVVARDNVYLASSPVGAIGNPSLLIPFASSLYKPKHNESVNFQNVRNSAEFLGANRTMGGGQWDEAIKAAYPGWEVDQLGKDLWSGDVGQLNYLEPDQCDDMHSTTVQGTVPPATTKITASDCGGSAIIFRGDNYTDYLIKKIQASPVWTNTSKRTAIVIMYDEGTATTGFNSCCGWNPSAGPSIAGKSLGVLVRNAEGSESVDTSVAGYNQGNKGHGTSIFGLLTNQPFAPKGIVDSDAYSHIAFVRTLQDVFQLADPGDDWSYMNRSKYTERFIAANLHLLPEYANSGDTHFDAVRPMNHTFVIPGGYQQKSGFVTPPGPQVGPDGNQTNAWAIK